MQFPLSAHDALSDAFFVSEWGAHLSYRTCHQTFSGLAHRAGICKRPDTGAQAKSAKSLRISSNLSKTFGLPPDGVYLAAAKTDIRSAHWELWQCPSTGELLASLGESPTEKKARISPFLNFLGKELVSDEDSAALQNW